MHCESANPVHTTTTTTDTRTVSTTLKKIDPDRMARWGEAAARLGMGRAAFMLHACDTLAEHLLADDTEGAR